MKRESSKYETMLAVLLLVIACLPALAADSPKDGGPKDAGAGACADFKTIDGNNDGFLSMEEFKAKGKDDLAFRAADIDGDARVDPAEYEKYLKAKAADRP